jgi:tetratricopeptide (TPR) repeat protein
MYFQLRKLILWPRHNGDPRVVDFNPGMVNVISGASKTGKTAVIPIIDYCLAADKCAIPVGVIRENCSWFGILIDTVEGQKLLARREPGDQQSTGDMVLIEGDEVNVPQHIDAKDTTTTIIKAMLNRLAGLTNLDFEPEVEGGFKSRPSFRDLMAFTFQPQNIVANPDVMFFKADTTEHREKLKTIFPYVLQALTADVLQARHELDRLGRLLRRRESDLRALIAAGNVWQLEVQSWLRQAIEFGLLPSDQTIPGSWPDIVDLLRSVVLSNSEAAHPNMAGIDVSLSQLQALRAEESEVAANLTQHRQSLSELRRLIESSEAYGSALRIQRDRLALSDWLKQLVSEDRPDDALAILGDGGREKIEQLSDALAAIEVRLRTHPSISDTLDKEILRLRGVAEILLVRLNEIRREIGLLERNSEQAKQAIDRFDRLERFLGRLEQALLLYDRTDQSAGLRQEIDGIKSQMGELQRRVSEAEIDRKMRNALHSIETETGRFVPQLDAEWPNAPVRLMINDLTVKVVRGTRDDYLWEIGSGANWLAYHVALTLALQTYFLKLPHHPVPGLLIYDQPSQVYFPRRAAGDDEIDPVTWRDEDVDAVRKVFKLLGEQAVAANGRLQIIVLDHADQDVWGDLAGVVLTEQWRDRALVPREWLVE